MSHSDIWMLLAHAVCTLMMTGVIWTVQLLNYPGFAFVRRDEFAKFYEFHVRRIGWVVGMPMLGEVFTMVYLIQSPAFSDMSVYLWTGFALLFVIWLSTLVLQIPEHHRLKDGFEAKSHVRLVAGNWIRTVGWTLRSALVFRMLDMCLSKG